MKVSFENREKYVLGIYPTPDNRKNDILGAFG